MVSTKRCPICEAKLTSDGLCVNPDCVIGKNAVFTLVDGTEKYQLTREGITTIAEETTEDNATE